MLRAFAPVALVALGALPTLAAAVPPSPPLADAALPWSCATLSANLTVFSN
jgi:hypothetical protein